MRMIRMAVLVAAASAAASKAKDYARENPEQASQTIDKVESFVAGKAGPKYADKVGKGSHALRSSLGLSPRTGGAAGAAGAASTVGSPATGPSTATSDPTPGASSRVSAPTHGSAPDVPPQAFDPSI